MARGEAGAQRGGCHGGPGSEEEGQDQVPRQVRRTEWAKEALGNLGPPGCEGGGGDMLVFSGHNRRREVASGLGGQKVGLMGI